MPRRSRISRRIRPARQGNFTSWVPYGMVKPGKMRERMRVLTGRNSILLALAVFGRRPANLLAAGLSMAGFCLFAVVFGQLGNVYGQCFASCAADRCSDHLAGKISIGAFIPSNRPGLHSPHVLIYRPQDPRMALVYHVGPDHPVDLQHYSRIARDGWRPTAGRTIRMGCRLHRSSSRCRSNGHGE